MTSVLVAADVHVVHVIDEETGRGVPLVELCTTSNVCFITDSQGVIAVDDPVYLGQRIFATIHSHGYRHPNTFFDQPAREIDVTEGGTTTIKIKRVNIAERLYRVTGEGIYRDSVLAGWQVPVAEPLLNARVTGLDTFMHTVYRGRLFWLFGDTNDLSAGFGHFATTCANSRLPGDGGLDPEVGINVEYFRAESGFAKPMAAIPGEGMKWMFALMNLRDPQGAERLVARYSRMKSLEQAYDHGLAVFDDAAREFRPIVSFGPNPGAGPDGRPTRVSVDEAEYFYFSWPNPTPVVRVRAEWNAVLNPEMYEVFQCEGGGCSWVRGGKPAKVSFIDIETNRKVELTAGSFEWNGYRNRWVAILQRNVGEVWYAEADSPLGPWAYAKKIVEHNNYTFYWPGQIRQFDRDSGRRIYFMGTYTQSFSGSPVKTPRYDYNQILYALSLDDPRMFLPVAHYQVRGREAALTKEEIEKEGDWSAVESVSYFDYQVGRRPEGAKRLPNPDPRPIFEHTQVKPVP